MTYNELENIIFNDVAVLNVELVTKMDGTKTVTIHFSNKDAVIGFLHKAEVFVLDSFIEGNYSEEAKAVYVNITDPAMYKVYVSYTNQEVLGLNIDRGSLEIIERKIYKYIPNDKKVLKLEGIPGVYIVSEDTKFGALGVLKAVGTNNKQYKLIPKYAFIPYESEIKTHLSNLLVIG